ncbi:uncharacterized protein ACLA_044670 [Aspergillus clavatus NRRL 1]|uniref:C6 zinc finger domain protein n=1 Tax=Aspergillus clavatus (strain ATCC 1007 / CBS 513.65 / DSM 816 / NCTC 3887 / NRRL 1 / QM 1276 / 107) TaxID=344612 RepID=A1C8W0_ASPCL|nr:uncharacterized protein ACLA_044670 [Aspergillus clavatus NRRL 1]EAW13747.1 conserved hypothetical protein [Aspergillus clavatus NRRL 1]
MPVQRPLRRSRLQYSLCSDQPMECSKTRLPCDGCRRHRLSSRYGDKLPSNELRRQSNPRPHKHTPPKPKASLPSSSSDSDSSCSPSPPDTHYPIPASSSTSQSPEPGSSQTNQDEESKASTTCPGVADLSIEDQLWDNWCASTERSLTQSQSKDRRWQAIIRRESAQYPALRHSTLALSALELASTCEAGTPEQKRHRQAAGSHYAQATETTPSISGPNAVFSAASILFLCDLASSTLAGEGSGSLSLSHRNQTPVSPKEDHVPCGSPVELLLDIFETARSLLTNLDILDHVETGDLEDLFTQRDPYHELPNTYTLTILSMRNLNAVLAKKDPSHATGVYTDTIARLDNSLEMLTKGGDPMMIALRWMYRIPSEYLAFVRDKQPLALIILAHYCAVLHHLRDRWWMGNLGTRLLKEICQLVGPDRLGSLLWATDIVGIPI